MIPVELRLSPTLSLRLCQTQKFKTEMLSLSAVLPIEGQKPYMTSLLLAVLLRGTASYPNISAINRRLDYLFGTELSVRNFYRGDAQVFGLCANLLGKEYLPEDAVERETLLCEVVKIMREIFYSPVLDENGLLCASYVESEKQLQCDALRAKKNHPQSYAMDRCRQLTFDSEPCGTSLYGTEEEVMAVTPLELTAHWQSICKNLSLHAFYVGASDADSVIAALGAGLQLEGLVAEPIQKGTPATIPLTNVSALPRRATEQRVCEDLPVHQSALVLSMRTPAAVQDDGFFAVAFYNELLGSSSPVSKLFINVREKLGLCYSCFSTYNAYKGALTVCCSLESDRLEEAEKEIRAQLAALAAGDISDTEWQAAQKSMENAYRQLCDSPSATEVYYLGRALAGVPVSPEEGSARIAALTREEVISVARQMTIDTVFVLHPTGGGEEAIDEET
jgi:predicted Zn-dependent peptidase